MIPSRLILLCLTTLWSFTSATVLMTQTSTWLGRDGLMKAHGFCTFNITKKLTKGKWKMTVNTDITTKYIKTWIMKVTERLDDGKTYKMKSKYEYGPQMINVQIRLSYEKGTGPVKATCSSNIEPVVEPTERATGHTEQVASTNIVQVIHIWEENGQKIMQGQCFLPITKKIEHYYLAVTLGQDTNGIVNWIATEYSKDPNGRWYILKNKWPAYAPELRFIFQILYDSDKPPTGACTVLTGSNPEPPVTSTPTTPTLPTQSPTTTKPTTQSIPAVTTSQPALSTKYDYAEVIRLSILFYEAQRSGILPADNRIPYRGDSAVDDQGFNRENLEGGWYDAGDGVKFNFPMAAATTVLSWGLGQWKDAYIRAGQLDLMYDSIKWPLDYFLKCWIENQDLYYCQVGDGNADHAFWGRHEEMTMARPAFAVSTSNPGSDVAGETAAALAAGSIAFATKDPAYAAELLSKARSLYAFAKTYRDVYSDSVPVNPFYTSYNGYEDELCFSAAMLYKATKENQYLQDAENFVNTGTAWSFSWDEKTPACQLILFQETGKAKYRTPVENFINDFMGNGVQQTNCGLAWRLQWGSNRYAANAAFIAIMAADTPGFANAELYKTWAMSQIHYMLGENKYGISYQIGYGQNYPRKPHHRASSCPDLPATCTYAQLNSPDDNPQILYGALVGGPDDNDNYQDNRTDYIKNEVTCDYNAGFQTAAAGLLHFALEGNLPAAPTAKCP